MQAWYIDDSLSHQHSLLEELAEQDVALLAVLHDLRQSLNFSAWQEGPENDLNVTVLTSQKDDQVMISLCPTLSLSAPLASL